MSASAPPKLRALKPEADVTDAPTSPGAPATAPIATPPRPERQAAFAPPEVEVGDVVRWHVAGAQGPGVPAIVTRVNSSGTLALSVMKVGFPGFDVNEKEAVMHQDDPALHAKVHLRHAGCWTLSPREERDRRTIASLTARLERLENR